MPNQALDGSLAPDQDARPMSRRANFDIRCRRCRLHESLCMCALIPRIETRTKLHLVIHRSEDRKSTNTGRLATECLVNSEVHVRGTWGEPSPPFAAPDGARAVLLYPGEDSTPIAEIPRDRPIVLVVPDGNWRQASKVRARVPGLASIPCVTIPDDAPSTYRLRGEAHVGHLATIEAIARAFGVLEGPEVRAALERAFDTMVERTLWARGSIATERVTGGIPAGAQRHEPRRKGDVEG